MIDVEVFGQELAPREPATEEIRRLCELAAAAHAVADAHVAIEFVDAERIASLNAQHRGKDEPTDVLSFPIDGTEGVLPAGDAGPSARDAPRELGDVIICPQHTRDVREAVVHGMLHLLGMDHESDDGEMLAQQRELLRARPR